MKTELIKTWRELCYETLSVKINGRRQVGTIREESFVSDFHGVRFVFAPTNGKEKTLYTTYNTGLVGMQEARAVVIAKYEITKL